MREKPIKHPGKAEALHARAEELDALDAILPFNRREKLAELLTDDDVATLKHLAKQGLGANTMRALASDLAYLEAWALASTGHSLPWPAPEALLIKFVAHHLWDRHQQELDPAHGMPKDVTMSLKQVGLLRMEGPHAPGHGAPPLVVLVNPDAMAGAQRRLQCARTARGDQARSSRLRPSARPQEPEGGDCGCDWAPF